MSGVGLTERIYEWNEYMSEEFQICLIFRSAVVSRREIWVGIMVFIKFAIAKIMEPFNWFTIKRKQFVRKIRFPY